ncbi:MAG: hypothetical protein CMF46_05685 [Legionellales bacterium]|nr:hypothetical protein [Legionellales bacterium]
MAIIAVVLLSMFSLGYADTNCLSLTPNELACGDLTGYEQNQCLATQAFFDQVDYNYCRSQCYGSCSEDTTAIESAVVLDDAVSIE